MTDTRCPETNPNTHQQCTQPANHEGPHVPAPSIDDIANSMTAMLNTALTQDPTAKADLNLGQDILNHYDEFTFTMAAHGYLVDRTSETTATIRPAQPNTSTIHSNMTMNGEVN